MGDKMWQLLNQRLKVILALNLELEASIHSASQLVQELESAHTYMKIGKLVEDPADSLLNRNEESA